MLLEILRYLTLFQAVFKTQRLFAVELVAQALLQVVLEIALALLVQVTAKPQLLLQASA